METETIQEHASVTLAREQGRIATTATLAAGVTIGEGSTIGNWCRIGRHTQIRDRVKIEESAEIGSHSTISGDVTIESYAKLIGTNYIGQGAIIKGGLTVPSYARITQYAIIEAGEWLHSIGKFYNWESYKLKDGTILFRFGCETYPLIEWTLELQNDLANQWDIEALPELTRVVRTVRAFWGLEPL